MTDHKIELTTTEWKALDAICRRKGMDIPHLVHQFITDGLQASARAPAARQEPRPREQPLIPRGGDRDA